MKQMMLHPRKLWGLLIVHDLIVSSWLPFFFNSSSIHRCSFFFQVFETVHIFWKHIRQNNLQGQSESHVLCWLVTSVASVHLTQSGQISLAGSFNNSTFYCFGQIDEWPHCHTQQLLSSWYPAAHMSHYNCCTVTLWTPVVRGQSWWPEMAAGVRKCSHCHRF